MSQATSVSEAVRLQHQSASTEPASARVRLRGPGLVSRTVAVLGHADVGASAVVTFGRSHRLASPVAALSGATISANVRLRGDKAPIADALVNLPQEASPFTSAAVHLDPANLPDTLRRGLVSAKVRVAGEPGDVAASIQYGASVSSARIRIRGEAPRAANAIAHLQSGDYRSSVSHRLKLSGSAAAVSEQLTSLRSRSAQSVHVRMVGSHKAVTSAAVKLRPVSGSVSLSPSQE